MNWLAILAAGAAYWVLGMLWYSFLFSKPWRADIQAHGVKVGGGGGMALKLIVTFVCNLIAAAVLARLFQKLMIVDLLRGIKWGVGAGVGFSATALSINYVWQSPPVRLWLIDAGYHIVGCIIMGAILSLWL